MLVVFLLCCLGPLTWLLGLGGQFSELDLGCAATPIQHDAIRINTCTIQFLPERKSQSTLKQLARNDGANASKAEPFDAGTSSGQTKRLGP